MKKPWSITTTLRNPERLRDFLIILRQLENSEWNSESQKAFQVLLIQNRKYGYGNPQFYNGLPRESVSLIDNLSRAISFGQAEDIFNAKNYEDPPMRGRQSINPLKKIGLVAIKNNRIFITDLGKLFMKDNFDIGEVFFRSFLKWQIPNPDSRDYPEDEGYDIKPFIGTLHLINKVNQKDISRGNKPKGISKQEFSLFVPTLVHYKNINDYAERIIALRKKLISKPQKEQRKCLESYKRQFAIEFLESNDKNKISKFLNNLQDYGDNAIRYFRLTRYIRIRGGGFYIDLEPSRSIEINALLSYDNAKAKSFVSKKAYLEYISDISQPYLPWETSEKHIEIIERLVREIREHETSLKKKNIDLENYQKMQNDELRIYIAELREYKRSLQNSLDYKNSQTKEQIENCVHKLKTIFEHDERPILLEKLSALGLQALNDALRIQPNYPVGDDNEPTFTAPANTPDIECFYDSFNAICEVTMLKNREQWYNEGQPVMRHLRDFEKKHPSKPSYCLFIAPSLHRDTINTFWTAVKYEFEGSPQKIIPLSISHFILILETLLQMKVELRFLRHAQLSLLYDNILSTVDSINSSIEWIESIPKTISSWRESILS